MSSTVPAHDQIVVEITLNNADHLPRAERQQLMQEFRNNLQIILGGADAMRTTLMAQRPQNQHREQDPSKDVAPDGGLQRALAVAEYTTWMGRDRPLGAHFGILFDRVTVN